MNVHLRILYFSRSSHRGNATAAWLEAITYADLGDDAALERAIDRILEIDPEVNTQDEADRWMTLLMSDLEEMRKG